MSDYNNDYTYNHMIRGYEDTWPGKREPARKKSDDTGLWLILSIICLVYSPSSIWSPSSAAEERKRTMGLFDKIFDFDNDGTVDAFEMALGYETFPRATQNYYGEEDSDFDLDFDLDLDDEEDEDEDEEELAEYFDSMQDESKSERRGNAHSVGTDIACLITELEDLQTRIQDAKSDLETLLETERDIHLELPDSLSCSEYETEMESAIDALEDAVRSLENADGDICDSLSQLEDASRALDMLDY